MFSLSDIYKLIPEEERENLNTRAEFDSIHEEYKDMLLFVSIAATIYANARDFDPVVLAQAAFIEGVASERRKKGE